MFSPSLLLITKPMYAFFWGGKASLASLLEAIQGGQEKLAHKSITPKFEHHDLLFSSSSYYSKIIKFFPYVERLI